VKVFAAFNPHVTFSFERNEPDEYKEIDDAHVGALVHYG